MEDVAMSDDEDNKRNRSKFASERASDEEDKPTAKGKREIGGETNNKREKKEGSRGYKKHTKFDLEQTTRGKREIGEESRGDRGHTSKRPRKEYKDYSLDSEYTNFENQNNDDFTGMYQKSSLIFFFISFPFTY